LRKTRKRFGAEAPPAGGVGGEGRPARGAGQALAHPSARLQLRLQKASTVSARRTRSVQPEATCGTFRALSSCCFVSKVTKAIDFPFGVKTSTTRPNCEKWRSRTCRSRHDRPPSTPATKARCCCCTKPGAPGSAGGASSRKRAACSLAPRSRPCCASPARRMSSRAPSRPGMALRWSGCMSARAGRKRSHSSRPAPTSRPRCSSRQSRGSLCSPRSLRCDLTCAVPCASPPLPPPSPPPSARAAVVAGAAEGSSCATASGPSSWSRASSTGSYASADQEAGAQRGTQQRAARLSTVATHGARAGARARGRARSAQRGRERTAENFGEHVAPRRLVVVLVLRLRSLLRFDVHASHAIRGTPCLPRSRSRVLPVAHVALDARRHHVLQPLRQ